MVIGKIVGVVCIKESPVRNFKLNQYYPLVDHIVLTSTAGFYWYFITIRDDTEYIKTYTTLHNKHFKMVVDYSCATTKADVTMFNI